MGKLSAPRIKFAVVFAAALCFALFLQGAVPFMAIPTLGQAVWTTGFSQSFANSDPLISLYAHNFGAPEPAAIAFGLAGAYPAALLIATGLHPADAYAAMAAFWLSVAFISAWRLGIKLGNRPYLSLLAALVWISMPVIWAHAGYSMTSLGIALLPFYFLASYSIFFEGSLSSTKLSRSLFYLAACIISVFMDGYSFMMFAAGSSLLGAYSFLSDRGGRRSLLLFSFPLHAAAFIIAFLLYTAYVGSPGFDAAPLDFFRGWGADISFFLIPTAGILWIGDALGVSIPRASLEFFGDDSVWQTTFLVPLFLAGLPAWWFTRTRARIATGLLIVAFAGLYMSLGPSLKFFSTRPNELIEAGQLSPMMPANLAVAPTGSAWISEHLPGFKNMRAAYRWAALAMFSLWWLLLLWLVLENSKARQRIALAMAALLLVFNLPSLGKSWNGYLKNREMFLAIDRDLLDDMADVLHPGEMVAFLPYRNDFLVNYLAASLIINTYNIGGDKNLAGARENWPPLMREFMMAQADPAFASRAALMLARQEADAIVFPFIDMLWAAHSWPPKMEYREQIEPILAELESTGLFRIERRKYYAAARVAPRFKRQLEEGGLERELARVMCLAPHCIQANGFPPTVSHQVGQYENGFIHADGRAGFLLFGPYSPMKAGKYRLVVRGTAEQPEGAWVDVASQKGSVVHGRFPIEVAKDGSEVLVDAHLTIDKDIEDVEVRLFVNEDSLLQVNGYKLSSD